MGLCVERLDVKVDEPSRGQGTAFFEGAAAGEQVPRSKRESVAIAVYAGCAAEENMGFETCAETDDHKRVEELLPGSEDLKQAARAKAAQIVKDRWIASKPLLRLYLLKPLLRPMPDREVCQWLVRVSARKNPQHGRSAETTG